MTVQTIADNEKSDPGRDSLRELAFTEPRDSDVNPTRGQIAFEIGEKAFIRAFDKDVDLSGAAKPLPGIEAYHSRLASSQNFLSAGGNLLLDATGAEGPHCRAIFADQHATSGSPIT